MMHFLEHPPLKRLTQRLLNFASLLLAPLPHVLGLSIVLSKQYLGTLQPSTQNLSQTFETLFSLSLLTRHLEIRE